MKPTWTLHLGDCRDYLRSIPEGCIGAVVTDPPFGIGYTSGHATDELWAGGREIVGDLDTSLRDEVLSMLPPVPTLCFGSWRAPRPITTRQVLVWDKGGALGMGALDIPWKPDHEEIYVIGKGWAGSRDCGSVIQHSPVQSMAKNGRVHPNEKPVGLMMKLLRKVPVGGAIFDPFAGSGTTGVAALRMGRKFIGCEISPEYHAIATRRLQEAAQADGLYAGVGA